MIDMIFLLLVFFILSSMYMSEVKTIPIKIPVAQNAVTQSKTTFVIAIKADGKIFLGDKQVELNSLVVQAGLEHKNNPDFAVVIRADQAVDYGKVITVLDQLKGAGVTRFGMATDTGDAQ
ncbi:MAG: biopolymer transporter ExbD [Acidaminococcaceae bacterium]